MSKKPTDETRIAGLTSILQSANKAKETPASPPPPSPAPLREAPSPEPIARKERKPGKSKDKETFCFKGVYIRKDTEKQARHRLEDVHPDKDFSELVELLLQQWLKSTIRLSS